MSRWWVDRKGRRVDWIEYWNGSASVYVSERHRRVHYALVADGIAQLVPHADAHVLDYGCGEALSADVVKAKCARLYLCDAAETVRAGLERRMARHEGVEVIAPEDLDRLPDGSVDLAVAHSVIQYLDEAALTVLMARLRRLLTPDGRIVFADIMPADARAIDDARALLGFGARNGFLLPSLVGLVRTAFSDYRRVRASHGLSRYGEADFLRVLERHGLAGQRLHPNLGHDQRRMAFAAWPIRA